MISAPLVLSIAHILPFQRGGSPISLDASRNFRFQRLGGLNSRIGREGDAPRIFMGIIRGKLWKNISDADEDRALGVLRRYRAENPERFRIAA